MFRYSYLNPESIYAQCEQAVQKLINDNWWMENIKKCFNQVLEDEGLQGDTGTALKMLLNDYLVIVDTVVLANEADINDFYTLAKSVGQEILDGNVIFSGMEQAAADKIANEESAEKYEAAANNASWAGEEWYYKAKASHYYDLADNAQKIYEQWKLKADIYDEIENSTKGLFAKSVHYREVIENATAGIADVFTAGEYRIDKNAEWRVALYQLSEPEKWKEGVQEALLEYGYTQEEIDVLKAEGVVVTEGDIEKLKKTVGTTSIYVSEDYNALLYNGKIYYINEPDMTDDSTRFESVWSLDYSVRKDKTDFNFLAALIGIEGEEIPTNDIYTADQNYQLQRAGDNYGILAMESAGVGSAFLLLESFMLSGLSHTEITIKFESAGNNRRVTILTGSAADRQKFQNINYDIPVNTFANQNDGLGAFYASEQAAAFYIRLTGNEPVEEVCYTIAGTLDERHKDCLYSGYLSFSEDGILQCTPIVFSGDTARISTCDAFWKTEETVLYDFTHKLAQPTPVDSQTQEMFEELLITN